MEPKKENTLIYCLTGLLFLVGVVCYAAFPMEEPENPIRIQLMSTAGNVLFEHKEHTFEEGYGLECTECHHLWEDEGEKPESCGECHLSGESDDEDVLMRSDAFHQQCIGCHEDYGSGPVDCSGCHIP